MYHQHNNVRECLSSLLFGNIEFASTDDSIAVVCVEDGEVVVANCDKAVAAHPRQRAVWQVTNFEARNPMKINENEQGEMKVVGMHVLRAEDGRGGILSDICTRSSQECVPNIV